MLNKTAREKKWDVLAFLLCAKDVQTRKKMTNVIGSGLKNGQAQDNGKGKNVKSIKSKAPKKDIRKSVCKNMASK